MNTDEEKDQPQSKQIEMLGNKIAFPKFQHSIIPIFQSFHLRNLYYCFAKSLNFVRHIGVGNASLKSPPTPL